jgi:UDP-N-acetylglucosamine:LPS N-acetylglucosamine transferase
MKRMLAIASGGGHWDELVLLRSAFADYEVTYAVTVTQQAERDGIAARRITDFSRSDKISGLRTAWEVFMLIAELRPSAVVTTGAAPGLLAVVFGKLFGARTVWIDGMAAADELSMSGKAARWIVDLHLSQWEHLADGKRTKFIGSIL